ADQPDFHASTVFPHRIRRSEFEFSDFGSKVQDSSNFGFQISDLGNLGNFDLQDILALNLSRAIQLCLDIGAHVIADLDVPAPETMGQTFDILADAGLLEESLATRLKKAVGFRNITVYNYETIDWSIVHSFARNRLGDFLDFAKVIRSISDAP